MEKVLSAFELLRILDREIPGQLVSTFLYVASHNGCHKQALELELGFTTASASRNTDWLAEGRKGIKHKGLGLIIKEVDPTNRRRQILRLSAKGQILAKHMKSVIYG